MAEIARSEQPSQQDAAGQKIQITVGILTVLCAIATFIMQCAFEWLPASSEPGYPSPAVSSEVPFVPRDPAEFEDDDARLAYAADLLTQGQHQAAEDFLSQCLTTVDSSSHIATAFRYDRGLARLYCGEYNQAIDDFTSVVDRVSYPDAYYNLGNALLGLEHYDKAADAYARASELEPKPEYATAKEYVDALCNNAQ